MYIICIAMLVNQEQIPPPKLMEPSVEISDINGWLFKDRESAKQLHEAAFAHKLWCYAQRSKALTAQERVVWNAWVEDAEWREAIYSALREAVSTGYHESLRRNSLYKIRTLIGYERYYHGVFPAPEPYWRSMSR